MKTEPVRQSVIVRSDIAHTFHVFVRDIGLWWPTRTHSRGHGRVRGVHFEEWTGGRVYEAWDDGTESTWGTLLAWDPPTGFTMTWDILPPGTEVELRFRSLGPGLTRVELEHRGWQNLTREQVAELAAERRDYHQGWAMILARFVAAAEPAADAPSEPTADAQGRNGG